MLTTRLWVGTLLVAAAVGLLALDERLAPWYPGLFALYLGLGYVTCCELLHLLGPLGRPPAWLCYLGLTALAVVNWLPHAPLLSAPGPPWPWLFGTFVAFVLAVFLVEMRTYREAGTSIHRMAVAQWLVCYLGLLPSFL